MAETLEQRAVARCTDEMARAAMFMRAYRGLMKSDSYHAIDFIRLAAWALHDQMIGHACKVLDRREQAGLWYCVNRRKALAAKLCAQHGVFLGQLRAMEKRLIIVRDRTLFHLDRRGVRNPKEQWKKAGINWCELDAAIDAGLRLLCALYREIRGEEFPLPYYDGSDATRIAQHAYEHDLLSTGAPVSDGLRSLFDI